MPGRDTDLLRDAAIDAGKIAERHFKQNPETWDKGGGLGPVTAADLEIDRMLMAELRAARPNYGWLSEETDDDIKRLDHEHVFIVDPIDGTRSFLAGSKTFAHSLAIAKNGVVVSAVVFLPLRSLMFEATVGQGALLNGKTIAASSQPDLEGAKILAATPQLDAKHWPGGVPPVERHFRSSLAYRMSVTAQGRFDGMLTLRDAWEWDIAAGDLICREAGAQVTDRFGTPLKFNNQSAQTKGVLAAGHAVHAELMARL